MKKFSADNLFDAFPYVLILVIILAICTLGTMIAKIIQDSQQNNTQLIVLESKDWVCISQHQIKYEVCTKGGCRWEYSETCGNYAKRIKSNGSDQ